MPVAMIMTVECCTITPTSLHWRYNDHDGVSNHQPHGCLLNRLFRRRWKKTSKLCVTGLCVWNSPASYAKNVSIWWRHHVYKEWPKLLACLISARKQRNKRLMVTTNNNKLATHIWWNRWAFRTRTQNQNMIPFRRKMLTNLSHVAVLWHRSIFVHVPFGPILQTRINFNHSMVQKSHPL